MFSFVTYILVLFFFITLSFVYCILGSGKAFAFCLRDFLNTFMLWSIFNLVLSLVGFKITISFLSLSVAACLGIPGLVSLMVAKLIV